MINTSFQHGTTTEAGREKIAAEMRTLIQDHIHEAGFARKILPPKAPDQLQVSTSGHDTLHCVLELPADVHAASINFRGDTDAVIVRGPKVAVGFWTIQTEKQQVFEQELLAYSNPIITMVEEKIPKALQEIEDRTFVVYAELAVQAVQLEMNGGVATALNAATIAAGAVVEDAAIKGELARIAFPTASSVPLTMQRPDIVRMKKLFTLDKQLRGETLLITEFDYSDTVQWTIEDLGNELTGETLRTGLKTETFFNSRLVQTLKTRILRPGNVYAFAPPEAMGVFYSLNDTKFFIDKRGNRIEFWAWEDIGMCIANIRAVAKLELYPCDANPATDADALLANIVSAAEENLGVLNNRADTNVYVRFVRQF